MAVKEEKKIDIRKVIILHIIYPIYLKNQITAPKLRFKSRNCPVKLTIFVKILAKIRTLIACTYRDF